MASAPKWAPNVRQANATKAEMSNATGIFRDRSGRLMSRRHELNSVHTVAASAKLR